MPNADRRAEFDRIQQTITAWALTQGEVEAVALVGSWARDEARPDSDIDVVVLTDSNRFAEETDWIEPAVGSAAELVRTEDWGALIERRVRLASGLEVEFGFARPSWAATDPVDSGTARVVGDGCLPWFDPEGLIDAVTAAVAD